MSRSVFILEIDIQFTAVVINEWEYMYTTSIFFKMSLFDTYKQIKVTWTGVPGICIIIPDFETSPNAYCLQ